MAKTIILIALAVIFFACIIALIITTKLEQKEPKNLFIFFNSSEELNKILKKEATGKKIKKVLVALCIISAICLFIAYVLL